MNAERYVKQVRTAVIDRRYRGEGQFLGFYSWGIPGFIPLTIIPLTFYETRPTLRIDLQ